MYNTNKSDHVLHKQVLHVMLVVRTMGSAESFRTEKNLLTAFAGESQDRNRCTYFASRTIQEGYIRISDSLTGTANQKKQHEKR